LAQAVIFLIEEYHHQEMRIAHEPMRRVRHTVTAFEFRQPDYTFSDFDIRKFNRFVWVGEFQNFLIWNKTQRFSL
jgi:hypothetical protein